VGFEVRLRPGHIEVLPWVKDSSREHEAVLLAGYKVSIERAFTDYVVTVSDDRHEPRRLIIALKA
jgi:hypothetical protein